MSKTDLGINTVEWNELNWRKIQKATFKLQKRIYRAYISGDVRKGRRLQKTLIKSYYNRLLSVRKVTQENQGKKTAGVDKVKSLTPKQRLELAKDLKLGDKSKPIRRVWIPKPGKKEKRPLGIPIIRDRIALHGMENRIKQIKGASLIRYADDFVILHKNLEMLQQCQKIIQEYLAQYDLELNLKKTKIVHTLHELNGNKPGFDFLGFNVRQYPVGKYQAGKNTKGEKLGFKTLVKPSKESIKRHYDKISEICRNNKAVNQKVLIMKLNPIIRGWTNYYRTVVSKETFSKLGLLTYQRLEQWARYRHPHKAKSWIVNKYWTTIGNDRWVFSSKEGTNLIKHSSTAIQRHIKVKGESSPYDGNTLYWSKRMGKHPEIKTSIAKLLKRQKGQCNWCNLTFQEGDLIENDHVIPLKAGGNKSTENQQLLHRHCHDEKTREDLKAIKSYKQEKEWLKLTKWFNNQNWKWVNDIPTLITGKGTQKEPEKRGAQ